jgi:tetratricopeptide (TPR) repeat protein
VLSNHADLIFHLLDGLQPWIKEIAVADADAIRFGKSDVVDNVVGAAKILLLFIFFQQHLVERFKPEKERDAFRIGHVFDEIAIMHDVLCDESSPSANFRMRPHQLADLQHVFAVVGKIIVQKDDCWIPAAETEKRAGSKRVVNCRGKVGKTVFGMAADFLGYHAKTASEAAASRCFHEVDARTDPAAREQTIIHGVSRDLHRRRLVDGLEFASLKIGEHSELADANVLQIHCHDIFASTPLYSIGMFVWTEAGLTVDDDKTVRAQKVANFLENFGLKNPENEDIIGSLLGASLTSTTEAIAPTPFLFKRKQFALLSSIVEQMARRQPTLIWVDEVHWIDPSSAELLQEIVASLAKSPVLVALTGRSFPKSPNLPPTDLVIELGQLTEDECYELARAMPRTQNLSDEELRRAVEAADGIPLFVEYLALSLVDQKEQASSASRRRGDLPLTLAAMISERLDRVADGRRVVQTAACIGRAFTADFLAALLQENVAKVIEPLELLIDAEIMRSNHDDREVRFEFRHALLQRAAYESMLQSDRRATHAGIVKDLQRDGAAGPFVPELIAHHLTASGQFQEAIKTWLDAGTNAARRSAHIEAIEDVRRGLSLLDEIPVPEVRAQLEVALQAALIASLIATQGPTSPALSACCQRGLALCKEGVATPLVFAFLFGQFTFAMCRGRVEDASPLAQSFLSLASGKSYDSGRVIGHRLLGMTFVNSGDVAKAKEQLEQSLQLYSAERDAAATQLFGQNTQVHGRSLLSIALFCLGQVDEALQVGLDALEAADALRHPQSTALAQGYVGGWLFGLCGAKNELMREAQQLIAVSQQHRLGPFQLFGTAFLGWAMCQHGDLENGIALLKKAVEKLESIEFRLSLPGHLANLADAQRRQGNIEDASKSCARALAMITDGTDRWIEPEIRRVDALVAADLKVEDEEKVEAKFRGAVACAKTLGFPVFELRGLLSLQSFLGPGRKDIDIESRLKELAHLQNLDRRVEAAIKARGYNLRALAD